MNRRLDPRVGVFLAVGAMLGCSNATGLNAKIETSLLVQPGTVVSGGEFTALLWMKNVSGRNITLKSGQSCISTLSVREAPWGDPVEGTGFGCLDVITDFPIQAGQEMSWQWDLKAETSSGILLDPGTYHLEAILNVPRLDHPLSSFQVVAGG